MATILFVSGKLQPTMMTNSFTGPETQKPASAGVKTGIPILEIRRLDRYLQSMGILFGFGFFYADHGITPQLH